MIYKLVIQIPLMSKPRGNIFNGRIVHSTKPYTAYKNHIYGLWLDQNGKLPEPIKRAYIGLFCEYVPHKGQQPDFLDNQLGGILDALTQKNRKVLVDDNRTVCFGDKLLCHPSDRNYSVLLIGGDNDVLVIDTQIQKMYNQIRFSKIRS